MPPNSPKHQALRRNNEPYVDHGIEVLYRFADIDPFEIGCCYFGHARRKDLGQFERFRMVLHTKAFRPLLNFESCTPISTLKLAEGRIRKRYYVRGFRPGEDQTYEMTLIQKLGGRRDGFWYTESLVPDGA